MDRETLAEHLADAAAEAVSFGQEFFNRPLPPRIRFNVMPNQSYDANLRPGEVTFPDDSHPRVAMALRGVPTEHVVDFCWREGRVPEWVNVSVDAAHSGTTFVRLECCGRFTDDSALLYHEREGRPPFHAVGPALPPGYQSGERFSPNRRFECWSPSEIEGLREVAGDVWLLSLFGPWVDDRHLGELPPLGALEIIQLDSTKAGSDSLERVARTSRLRVLRLANPQPGFGLDPTHLPSLPDVTDLSAEFLGDVAVEITRRRLPRLEHLALTTGGSLSIRWRPQRQMRRLSLTASELGNVRLPRQLESLSLAIATGMGHKTINAISRCDIKSLHLRGTPLSDQLSEVLTQNRGLEFADLVGTGISADALDRIRSARPGLRVLPRS